MAKRKFNEQQREVVGTNCISAIIYPGVKKRVAVYCGSDSAGAAVAGAIQSAYPSYKLYKSTDQGLSVVGHVLMGVFTLGAGNLAMILAENWQNFTVETNSQSDSEKLVEEIGSCIDEYGGYVDSSGLTGDIPPITTGTGTNSKAKNTTLYIIVGAVLAVVIAFVLTRKKKK